jgi:hypothetical protein
MYFVLVHVFLIQLPLLRNISHSVSTFLDLFLGSPFSPVLCNAQTRSSQ